VTALHEGRIVAIDFPDAASRVSDRALLWGRAEQIGSPAYWASQAWMWGIEEPDHYRLGRSLKEEVLACLLGGYGIPAEVGLAAYERLRHAIENDLSSESRVLEMLLEPLHIGDRQVRYRFARQKARHISGAIRGLPGINVELGDRTFRDELTTLPGVGPKTASWIVRNWRRSDDVAILDVHILRAGRILGIFPEGWRVERDYRELEDAYLAFARDIGAPASILDSVMWMTMRRLPSSLVATFRPDRAKTPARIDPARFDRRQAALI
jgi:thermostable 8-oxoguanine DNA glycosylase